MRAWLLALCLWVRTITDRFNDRWPPGTAVVTA